VAALPTGTVTFLFTDIEGSTTLLQRLGDRRYAEVLDEHRRILRDAFADGHGQEIDTQGDAFLVAFSRARDALATAVAAQRALTRHSWPDGASLRVRMGLHTGEPVTETRGYVGLDLHRAARICAAGHGGQIVVSDAVSGLAARDLPSGVSLRDLGTHRLKDLKEPEHLFQVAHPDLAAAFPPPKSLDARPNNLPVQLTSFIGREREIAEVKRLLGAARLVTLTGSGGAGKTRLALQVAADVVESYPEGAWLAELAPIADPALVTKAVASAVNVPEQPGRGITETLVDALRSKAVLLVLDNCEHLLAACRDLAAALLRTCSQVRILATSREGLGVPGETLWRVPSLSIPEDIRHLPAPEELVLYDAVHLFVDRAVATAPAFTVTSKNASAVAQVCQRLDGIPLAIELAAARVKVLAVEQIAARLDDRFRLLTGGSPIALPRHQTLRAAIDWSYNLLSESERVLLRRLSVFAGGWTLEAAETVSAGGAVDVASILDVLTSLVEKSLVLAETHHGEARHELLETVRQYARERLVEAGEVADVRSQHRDWYLALAEQAAPGLQGLEQANLFERLETELDNFRAALDWSLTEDGRTDAGMRLSVALWEFWRTRDHHGEGSSWLERALAHDSTASTSVRAKALSAAGSLARSQGDYERASALVEESLVVFRQLGDKLGVARALVTLGNITMSMGRHLEKAESLITESLTYCREAEGKKEIPRVLNQLGEVARSRGDYAAARSFYEESLAMAREVAGKRSIATTLHNLAAVELAQGDHRKGEALLRESLDVCRELKHREGIALALVGFAGVAIMKGHQDRGARLLGATDVLLSTLGIRLDYPDQIEYKGYVDTARTALGDSTFAANMAEGRAMTLEQAIEYALKDEEH
jgi:predicted ATPase/class 3 adenylate cyclase